MQGELWLRSRLSDAIDANAARCIPQDAVPNEGMRAPVGARPCAIREDAVTGHCVRQVAHGHASVRMLCSVKPVRAPVGARLCIREDAVLCEASACASWRTAMHP